MLLTAALWRSLSSKVDGCIIAEENTGNDKEPYNFYLSDSSELSALNNIEELSFYNIYVEDISGVAYMDSLKRVTVSEGFISDEVRKLLEDKGIIVVEKSKGEWY